MGIGDKAKTLLDRQMGVAVLIGAVGIALALIHLMATPYNVFSHDVEAHVTYIRYILDHHTIPKPYENWEFYHPPLYYVIAAVVWAGSQAISDINPFYALGLLSIGFYAIYLYYSSKLIINHVTWAPATYCALAVLAWWPLGINMARVINNDVPLFMAQTVGFYYLSRWWKNTQPADLIKALLWNAIGINFKSSGLIFSGVIAFIVFAKWFYFRFPVRTLLQRKWMLGFLCAVLIVAAPLWRSYYYYRIEQGHNATFFAMAGVWSVPENAPRGESKPALDNAPYHFLTFDLATYAKVPFYDVFKDAGGRQYFWNAVLKTSLFDEFLWRDEMSGLLLSMIELLMLFYMAVAFALPSAQGEYNLVPVGIGLGVYVGALLGFRIVFPQAFHQEYRFIFAATPLFVLLYGASIERYRNRHYPLMSILGVAMGVQFAIISLMLILQQDWH